MKRILVILLTLGSLSAFSNPITVDEIFYIYDQDREGLLTFLEHKQVFANEFKEELKDCTKSNTYVAEKIYLYLVSRHKIPKTFREKVAVLLSNYDYIATREESMEHVLELIKAECPKS